MIYYTKSYPPPKCLEIERMKASGNYSAGDVLERLRNDFKNKCYICGEKSPVSINVEHFRPHKDNKDLKFDWKNLFWSCQHCNYTKSDKFTNILNCTDIDSDIEMRIKTKMNPYPKEKVTIEPQDELPETIETADLLNAVFNGTTVHKKLESNNLREKINTELGQFRDQIIIYYNEAYSHEDREKALREIRMHLNSGSSFTEFKRWIVRDNEVMIKDFGSFFI